MGATVVRAVNLPSQVAPRLFLEREASRFTVVILRLQVA